MYIYSCSRKIEYSAGSARDRGASAKKAVLKTVSELMLRIVDSCRERLKIRSGVKE